MVGEHDPDLVRRESRNCSLSPPEPSGSRRWEHTAHAGNATLLQVPAAGVAGDVSAMTDKQAIRAMMREKRRSLGPAAQRDASDALLGQLVTLGMLAAACRVGMYMASDGEIDPSAAMRWCWRRDIGACVPILPEPPDRKLVFVSVNPSTRFAANRYGIREPANSPGKGVMPRELDVVLLPLVAFDGQGSRVGMGGGYYDATFRFVRDERPEAPVLVGVAHDFQKVDAVPFESWDVPLRWVITPRGVYNQG